jgi:hypothetical protein
VLIRGGAPLSHLISPNLAYTSKQAYHKHLYMPNQAYTSMCWYAKLVQAYISSTPTAAYNTKMSDFLQNQPFLGDFMRK